MVSYLAYCGLMASVWIVVGVYIAAKYYPNYSHQHQFCSELGAKGCATERLSPRINNYPLALLFTLFGYSVIQLMDSAIMDTIGVLIIIHGIGTWVVGYFPMDKDPYTKTPSFECKVHYWAGTVMLLALLIAIVLMLFAPENAVITFPFKVFSAFMLLTSIYFTLKLSKAYQNNVNTGLHQRISYGALLVWLGGFSLMLS